MSLNIEDPEVLEVAQLLSDETGESMTAAVTQALRERLARIRHERKKQAMLADLGEIGRHSAALMRGPSVDHADLLYDENGLPK